MKTSWTGTQVYMYFRQKKTQERMFFLYGNEDTAEKDAEIYFQSS